VLVVGVLVVEDAGRVAVARVVVGVIGAVEGVAWVPLLLHAPVRTIAATNIPILARIRGG
jgi:hypothetical protein